MAEQTPEIVIVMPVFQQAAFADEAIYSVVSQTETEFWHLVIVNDGSTDRATSETLVAWQLKFPEKITLLTQQNAGLAQARNTGIYFALTLSGMRAVFFLDSDNRLDPHAIALFRSLLERDKSVGWFYPNFDMFGSGAPQSNGGKWSLSRMAISNMCDAGSLVNRELFDAGLRFNTSMRHGYEDWDFWLKAAQSGFVGQAIDTNFFRYRKRTHSMLSSAHGLDEALQNTIRAHHPWLYKKGNLARKYLEEWPRFAFVDSALTVTFGDLPEGNKLTVAEAERLWFAATADPFSNSLPECWVFYNASVLDFLVSKRRLASVLLQLEACCDVGEIGALYIKNGDAIVAHKQMRFVDRGWERLAPACVVAIPRRHMNEALQSNDLLECLEKLTHNTVVAPISFEAPDAPVDVIGAAETAIGFVGMLAESNFKQQNLQAVRSWRADAALSTSANLKSAVQKETLGGLPLPGQSYAQVNIGFAVPIFRFGGVEKTVVALAASLRQMGFAPHLFIVGDDVAADSSWLYKPFVSVHQISRPELRDWSGNTYFGTPSAREVPQWISGQVFGPMLAMDIVVNSGCGAVNSGIEKLSNYGVRVIGWEHLLDTTAQGRPYGTPYLALGQDGAYELILTCSDQLSNWLAGMGVSRNKILPLPNGPGFPDKRTLREPRDARLPLRVGFMGRLDRQKGVERFVEVTTLLHGPEFAFSLVGTAVVEADEIAIPDFVVRHPLARTPDELSEAYARLDVLLMPSRAEGLPLTVLEAQRAGVVPVISDVGAVSEAVVDGENGILLNPKTVVGDAIAALKRLAQDREFLHRLATAPVPDDRWADNATKLLSALGIAPLA